MIGSVSLAGDFVNLTFDEPNLNGPLQPLSDGSYTGSTSDLLRGWSVSKSGVPVTLIAYAPSGTTGVQPVILTENVGLSALSPFGRFGLELYATPLADNVLFGLHLSQTGTIPLFATGLEVDSRGYVQGFINGIKIGDVNPVLGTQATWDVRPYQGQNVKLEIYVRPNDTIRFDILGFRPIPEPSTWALLGMGTALLGWQTWRRHGKPL